MKGCLPLLLAGVAVAGEMKVETKTLQNGLQLVAIYHSGSKSESIFTFLPMGLTSDGPGQTQWSHLVEHLVVRSTAGADVEHFNAETLPDHMRLDSYGTIDNWQQALGNHRRRLQGVAFTAQRLQSEKPNVIQETVTTARNSFTHKFALAAWAQASRHGRSDVAVNGDVMSARLEAIERYRGGAPGGARPHGGVHGRRGRSRARFIHHGAATGGNPLAGQARGAGGDPSGQS